MSINRITDMGSPMDLVFATPQGHPNSNNSLKRKCVNDSGYNTPIFGNKSKYNFSMESPEVSGSSSLSRVNGNSYTPFMSAQDVKKRLISSDPLKGHMEYTLHTPSVGEVDSYSDFLHDSLSLYTEPMDTAPSFGTTTEDSGIQGSLGLLEVSKKIQVEMEEEPVATRYQPKPSPSLKGTPKKTRDLGSTPRRRTKTRSLAGFGHLDIMYQLGEKSDYSLVVTRILSYLSDQDISNMTMVSKTWRNVCLRDEKASARWHNYIADRKERKENLSHFQSYVKKNFNSTPLSTINHSTPLQTRQPKSPPVSPSKKRFHLFQKEVQKLKSDERLAMCPRCTKPSACTPSKNMGQCTCISCQMRFCTVCRCEYHEGKPCPAYMTPIMASPKKRSSISIGSKESRKNLRRL